MVELVGMFLIMRAYPGKQEADSDDFNKQQMKRVMFCVGSKRSKLIAYFIGSFRSNEEN